jgi:hypothetical protein
MRFILFLAIIFFLNPLFAQNDSKDKLLGSWKLQSMDAKKLMPGISMSLKVEPETMIILNDFDEINCNWAFSNNGKYIYCSNDKSDEEWQLIELSDTRLIVVDKGRKMEFLRTAAYKKPVQKDIFAEVNKTETVDREKLLLGDWNLVKIDSKDISKAQYSLSFRPKGGIYYNFGGIPTPASWALNEDKKSLTITAYNGLSETWVINSFDKDELKIYVAGKYYFFTRS